MGGSRGRRLSTGRKLLDDTDDDASGISESERVLSSKKKIRRRRRSSWAREDEDESAQKRRERLPRESSCSSEEVAEMYRKVIKMASENKITTKNAWSLSLIDHMSEVVADDAGEDERRRQRQEHAVNFQKASCTLEAGVKIYCSRVDDTFDSSFRALERLHRRSQKPDDEDDQGVEEREAGDDEVAVKRKTKRSVATKTLVEDEETISAGQVDEEESSSFVLAQRGVDGGSARDLLLQRLWCVSARVAYEDDEDREPDGALEPLKSSFSVVDLPTALCTPLAHFRATQTSQDEQTPSSEPPLPDDYFPPEPSVEHADEPTADDRDSPPFADYDDDHHDAPIYDDFDDEDGDEEEEEEEARQQQHRFATSVGLKVVADEDDLAYLDTTGLSLGRNEWAGLSHWKLATARQGKPAEKKRAPTKKKKLPGLDFEGPPPPPMVPAPKQKKQPIKAVDPNSLVLPKDLGITARDLYKLFLVDRYVVATGTSSRGAENTSNDASFVGHGDDDDAFFEGGGHDEDFDAVPPPPPEDDEARDGGGAIGLLSASHQVENIDISYATTAKRVDVRALKAALWNEIDGRKAISSSHGSSSKNDDVTFSSVVRQVCKKQNFGTDVTMSFFFISLLHLANEHQLNISDDLETLSDLSISK